MATAGTWLLLVELSRQHAEAASPGTPHFQTLSALLVTTQSSITAHFTSIAFCLGSLMFYSLFYQSRLVPRWLSVWGLAGAVLYLAAPLLDMFGHGLGVLMAPLAVAEIVLAVWLIARGLNAPAARRTPASDGAPADGRACLTVDGAGRVIVEGKVRVMSTSPTQVMGSQGSRLPRWRTEPWIALALCAAALAAWALGQLVHDRPAYAADFAPGWLPARGRRAGHGGDRPAIHRVAPSRRAWAAP